MDLNSILNQVLDVAKNSASKLETGNQTIDSLTKVGGGAALGGILSMILGRSGGASLAKLGSLAVLGNLAYQAYQILIFCLYVIISGTYCCSSEKLGFTSLV